MIGLFAGLRTGELHRLRWNDIAIDNASIEIVGKGAHRATVAVPPQLQHQLVTWRLTVEAIDGFDNSWPVLPVLASPRGDVESLQIKGPLQALSIEGIRQVVNRHGARIGVAYLRPHDLRRTLAATLDARGLPLQDIRVVLRHETLTATHAYLADNPRRAHARLRHFTLQL